MRKLRLPSPKAFLIGVAIALVAIPAVGLGLFTAYLSWPRFFPKYAIGTCVEDFQVQRIYRITGYDDWFKGSGVPTVILRPGAGSDTLFAPGTQVSIDDADPAVHVVACPEVSSFFRVLMARGRGRMLPITVRGTIRVSAAR